MVRSSRRRRRTGTWEYLAVVAVAAVVVGTVVSAVGAPTVPDAVGSLIGGFVGLAPADASTGGR